MFNIIFSFQERVWHSAAPWPPRRGGGGHGLLLLQHGGHRRQAGELGLVESQILNSDWWSAAADAGDEADPDHRLGHPPRQRHAEGLLRGSEGALHQVRK